MLLCVCYDALCVVWLVVLCCSICGVWFVFVGVVVLCGVGRSVMFRVGMMWCCCKVVVDVVRLRVACWCCFLCGGCCCVN